MKHLFYIILIAFSLFSVNPAFSQQQVNFKFTVPDKEAANALSNIISIDNVKGNEVWATATDEQFEKFRETGYSYTILPAPGDMITFEDLNMGNVVKDASGRTIWNFYPTYQQYLDFMAGFANDYPDICRVDTIGTSKQGRLLLAVRISDSVELNQGEPEVLLTSSIHGDELVGYVCMLHLIDSILTGYDNSSRITDLVNNHQLYINPLANPDGTYRGGNNTVQNAWRYNSNGIDLNRNFPDPDDGPHPDGNAWQMETQYFMRYDTIHRFTMSMNFHGGAEVYNYPWDTWSKLHADDEWWIHTGREYADTVHAHSPSYYFRDLNNGITNGYQWYTITGGRQDYTTYFHYGREVTLEISSTKLPSASQLLNFWNYNKRSFLNYIEQASYGINGQVTDTVTGEPLKAKVNIWGHDLDNSFVYSDSVTGWYFRPIDEGNWSLTFTCQGYYPKTINADAAHWTTTVKHVQMVPLTYGIGDNEAAKSVAVYPNPSKGEIVVTVPDMINGGTIRILSSTGIQVYQQDFSGGNGGNVRLDLTSVPAGVYIVEVRQGNIVGTSRLVIVR